MENHNNFNQIAYKRAQKRVKEVKNYYYFIVGYLIVATILLYKNYDGNIFDLSTHYIIWMLILQGIFLALYGLYLFIPSLYNWEERKTEELTKKFSEKN